MIFSFIRERISNMLGGIVAAFLPSWSQYIFEDASPDSYIEPLLRKYPDLSENSRDVITQWGSCKSAVILRLRTVRPDDEVVVNEYSLLRPSFVMASMVQSCIMPYTNGMVGLVEDTYQTNDELRNSGRMLVLLYRWFKCAASNELDNPTKLVVVTLTRTLGFGTFDVTYSDPEFSVVTSDNDGRDPFIPPADHLTITGNYINEKLPGWSYTLHIGRDGWTITVKPDVGSTAYLKWINYIEKENPPRADIQAIYEPHTSAQSPMHAAREIIRQMIELGYIEP